MPEIKGFAGAVEAKSPAVMKRREAAAAVLEKTLAWLDVVELPVARLEQLAVKWENSGEGRAASVYLSDISTSLWMQVARGESFGHAAEAFAEIEDAMRSAFPDGWTVNVPTDFDDGSTQDMARRSVSIEAFPPGGSWYNGGVLVIVSVSVRVDERSECRVVQAGTVEQKVTTTKTVPRYVAICPGDALRVVE